MSKLWLAAILLPSLAFGQALAGLVQIDAGVLESKPTLATWQKSHPAEKRTEPSYSFVEYESQSLWCAASAASITLSNGVVVHRSAFFYIPPITGALPAKVDKTLVNQCQLLAIWYEVNQAPSLSDFLDPVKVELTQAWGAPQEAEHFSRLRHGWGQGYWDPFLVWEHGEENVVAAIDSKGTLNGPFAGQPRAMVLLRSAELPDDYFAADLGAGYSPRGQPLPLPADVEHLEKFCSFEGERDWRDGLIAFGEQLLRDQPTSKWEPWVRLILSRTYDAKLLRSYPDADPENLHHEPLDPVELRDSAIRHFRAFLAEKPNDPDAPYARHEAWRLLAGLPPTTIHFACVD